MEKSKIEKFREMLLDDSYINWLSNYMNKNKEIDDIYYPKKNGLNETNKKMIGYLGYLFSELRFYYMKNNGINPYKSVFNLYYNDKFFSIIDNGEGYTCKVFNNGLSFYYKNRDYFLKNEDMYICYNDLKEQYMDINFSNLEDLIIKVLDKPREFYEKICNELTTEERLYIINKLKNKDCTTCINGSCNVETYEKDGLNEYGKAQGYNCVGWYNDYLIGKSKVLKKDDINKLI